MNKIFKKLSDSSTQRTNTSNKIKGAGKTFDWCKSECEKIGLELDVNDLLKEYDVYEGNRVIGRYYTISEVKQAIKKEQ